MESELNLDDLQRIAKALVQYQATTENEEVFLTQGTIKRVIRMGAELENWLKEEYQVKTEVHEHDFSYGDVPGVGECKCGSNRVWNRAIQQYEIHQGSEVAL